MLRINQIIFILFLLMGLMACSKNKCVAKEPNSNCICTQQYEPVCGCNGITYGNSCDAECHGIKEYTKGECR